jgi:hypothetical protein
MRKPAANRRLRGTRGRLVAVIAAVTAAAAVGAVALATAVPANAGTVDRRTSYAAVQGRIDVVDDTTTWELFVWRLAGRRCVYARVTLELSRPHRSYESARVCSDGTAAGVIFRGGVAERRTRGARVALCQDLPDRPDHCVTVWREPARSIVPSAPPPTR